jgi:hypothetical protein
MKKKLIFDFVLVLLIISCILIFFVNEGHVDRFKIKRVVNNYFSALSAGQYELAKTYCVKDGISYKYAEIFEKPPEGEIGLVRGPIFTSNISKYYTDSIDIEFVMTMPILGTSLRKTYNTRLPLTKEKRGLLGSWKLK